MQIIEDAEFFSLSILRYCTSNGVRESSSPTICRRRQSQSAGSLHRAPPETLRRRGSGSRLSNGGRRRTFYTYSSSSAGGSGLALPRSLLGRWVQWWRRRRWAASLPPSLLSYNFPSLVRGSFGSMKNRGLGLPPTATTEMVVFAIRHCTEKIWRSFAGGRNFFWRSSSSGPKGKTGAGSEREREEKPLSLFSSPSLFVFFLLLLLSGRPPPQN